jgi:NADPH:quinone reductase-like Zn-dependent oxidoreductase
MKALQIVKYGDLKDSLTMGEIEKPSVKTNDILVAVKAASLNPIDFKLAEGKLKEMVHLNLPSTIGFDAYQYLATGRAKGKVIITLS